MSRFAGTVFSCFILVTVGLQAAIPKPDNDLLKETTEKAAYVQALAGFCDAKQPGNQAGNRQALDEWNTRNYWNALEPKLAAQPVFNPAFAQLKAHYTENLTNGGQKMLQLCGYVPKLLRYPSFDPSSTRSADLQRIASLVSNINTKAAPLAASGSGGWPKAQPVDPGTATTAPAQTSPAAPLTPAIASGQEVTAGGATFHVPPGWRVTKSSADAAVMQKSGKYGGKSVVFIGIKPLAGDVTQSLRASLQAEFPQMQLKNIQAARTRSGVLAAFARDYGRISEKQSAKVRAAAFALSGRIQLAEMLSTGSVTDTIDHDKEFEAMVQNFRLQGTPTTAAWNPLAPPAGSGGVASVFLGSTIRNELNPLGGLDLKAIRTYIVLLKNGQVYRDIPDTGHVLDMDFATALEKHPKDCGTYKIQGGKIAFTWLDDYGLLKDEIVPYHRGNPSRTSIDLGSVTVSAVSAARNLKMNGRYTSTFYMSGNTAMSSTGITAQTFIAFSPDGTYQKSGFSSASFSNSAGTGTTSGTVSSKKGVETGRYAIDGYTLSLMPAGASGADLYTIIFEELSTSPKAVFINDKAFLR